MSAALVAAVSAQLAAARKLRDAIEKDYPIDGPIKWVTNGDRVYCGIVVMHGYGERICVRNTETGRTRWITAGDVVQAFVRANTGVPA